ncbi:hypothetical protein T4D_5332, partial [Trichinella pseudospiralis]
LTEYPRNQGYNNWQQVCRDGRTKDDIACSAEHRVGSNNGSARFLIEGDRILQFRSYLEINFINDSNLMGSCLLTSLTSKAFEEL